MKQDINLHGVALLLQAHPLISQKYRGYPCLLKESVPEMTSSWSVASLECVDE